MILISPSSETKLELAPPHATLWMLIDRPSSGTLPDAFRQPLAARGVAVQRHPATPSTPEVELTVRTAESVARLAAGTTRRDLELRWTLMHAEPVADRLRRLEALAAEARRLPEEGLERATRGLWLDAHAAARALWPLGTGPVHALAAAGELSSALLRLSCLMDEGAYPPAEQLRAQATDTRIGQRLGGWLDDLLAGVAGDAAAGRRAVNASLQVLEEVRIVLRERYSDREWLRSPTDYELRSRR